ncbi:RNA dependent RNA polymerase-domain-containing protein [Rhodofomes roseus]|uniref:RNA-dependent RNA polymerase n=1 Tax=Rhodofomes roseus TaxID=34475 RepID=A0ABQ8KDC8_9APHY|nr:RNA dependent RNA polymerase-domain-containing protein [Rhodofomes roseus]KAH9835627.1 RNA dependent RNA polymerase-domain-containing protein [Rhodofomes roseus]
MEICMYNIAHEVDETFLKTHLEAIFRGPRYRRHPSDPTNFAVRIFRQNAGGRKSGTITVPTTAIGEQFLREHGGKPAQYRLVLGNALIIFKQSSRLPRGHQARASQRGASVQRQVMQHRRARNSTTPSVGVAALQFGHFCRDDVFSVEWEKNVDSVAELVYEEQKRQFVITWYEARDTRYVVCDAASIYWIGAGDDAADGPVILLGLNHAPSYEFSNAEAQLASLMSAFTLGGRDVGDKLPKRSRMSAFDPTHMAVASFTSLAIRILCKSAQDLDFFRVLGRRAQAQVDEILYPAVARGLFAPRMRRAYDEWVLSKPWPVAFQMEALVRASLVELQEVLDELRHRVDSMLLRHGAALTGAFLHDFRTRVKAITSTANAEDNPLQNMWAAALSEFLQRPSALRLPTLIDNEDLFPCFHVIVTPTTMFLEGPYPEQSNRVIRQHKASQDSFIRVSFLDETRLAYRFDRDVDSRDLIDRRVRHVLKNGLPVAGRTFQFLAYSQSGLKEHAVWFVKPFRTAGRLVNADSIIRGLGSFHKLPYDKKLMYCPARYAARISQAFTATDSALTVQTEDMIAIPDVVTPDRKYCFTDGVGTLSPELAQAIWGQLRAKGRRAGRASTHPRLYQIRLGGSKGMLSVDHNLTGLTVGLRPSMNKFYAPHSLSIEIARAFDRPSKYYLNRPLIMLLEGLGVPYEVFQALQDDAVRNVERAVESFDTAAHLLEAHGLGTSYRLSSTMRSLHRLGVEPSTEDTFWQRMMDFAVNHVLRELKHHARIPVPDGWTLVGVADSHGYLEEGEIFACVDAPSGHGVKYLEGPILITRSPAIHPGDVQIVQAIGAPPEGSPFDREPLTNGVVFSTKGHRPISTYLGGGDLDGDVYNLTPMAALHPPVTEEPAAYEPAVRRTIKRKSTMEDVADFVADYISSDTLGIIAMNWLMTADRSSEGIFDEICLELAGLHSIAVDYPKTGNPVLPAAIPPLGMKKKPDWHAPETHTNNRSRYYESQRAIGKLFRAIKLPALRAVKSPRPRHMEDVRGHDPESIVIDFRRTNMGIRHGLFAEQVIERRVNDFITASRTSVQDDTIIYMGHLLASYASHLRSICALTTISVYSGSAILTEEEALIGTIAEKTSQPRRRTDAMARLRDLTERLVKVLRADISGDDGTAPRQSLEHAWVAYRVGLMRADYFGARSFAWVALGEIFDAVRDVEEEDNSLLRRNRS